MKERVSDVREVLLGHPEIREKEHKVASILEELRSILEKVLKEAADYQVNLHSEKGRKQVVDQFTTEFEKLLRRIIYEVERR